LAHAYAQLVLVQLVVACLEVLTLELVLVQVPVQVLYVRREQLLVRVSVPA